ncbi:MAG TPA: cytochrome d ubiquinol oxidase subunit II [Ignavibacteria bacterium]|jgi:cytochrome d ubiquinol oxidase subunit II
METFWFIALVFMMIMYVILDGFDLGMGIFFLKIAKTDDERRTLLNSIGPVWDGNEVWLIAAGGTLFFAFPKFYASSFSGFYLPFMILLWLLIGRALGIELRKHINNNLWKSFWDVIFSISSILITIIFGAALGNVMRGVPIQQDGYFFEPLWTTLTVVPEAGILDWYTILMAGVAVITLTAHSANFTAMKTDGALQQRARNISRRTNAAIIAISLIMFISTTIIRPELWNNYFIHLWGFIFPLAGLAGMIGMIYFRGRENDNRAFISSSIVIAGMLAGTAFGLYPSLLQSTINPDYSLTIYNTNAGNYGLAIGTYWWIGGMILAAVYFAYLFYIFKGKVKILNDDEGY